MSDAHSRWKLLEPVLWCAVALAATVVSAGPERLPRLTNDSFQYLAAANELRSSQRFYTPLVQFNTEKSHVTIPAPLTTFPPGYPATVAAISTLGVSYETAALTVSVVSFVLVTGILWHLMLLLDPSRWAARAAVLCWLANSQALTSSVSAHTEMVFTALGLASILLLMHTNRTAPINDNTVLWIGSATVAGVSYWVRYAGVFLALTIPILLLIQIGAGGGRIRDSLRAASLAAVTLVLLLSPLMVRNVVLVGDWKGGNTTPAAKSALTMLASTPALVHHWLHGDGEVSQLWFPLTLVVVGLIGVCVVALRGPVIEAVKLGGLVSIRRWLPTNWGIVLTAFAVYGAGVAVVATRTVTEYSPRMYIPVLPHLIALIVCAVAFLMRRLPLDSYGRSITVAATLCLLAGYLSANAVSWGSRLPDARQRTEAILLQPDDGGRYGSIKQIIDQEFTPGEILASTNGQAAGYVLGRPTLSLVGRPQSLATWDERAVRAELARFGTSCLLVFRDAALSSVVKQSPFLGALAAGQSPSWLQLIGANEGVCVYRVEPGQ